jgi:hypothetical protein
MSMVRKYMRLPPGERWLRIQAAVLVAVMRLALWLVPFRHLRSLVARAAVARPEQRVAVAVEHLAYSVRVTSQYVPRASCLTQALAGQILLARHGHPARVHIGVARAGDGAFTAHAWLESNGRVVLGGRDSLERFSPLLALEAERP